MLLRYMLLLFYAAAASLPCLLLRPCHWLRRRPTEKMLLFRRLLLRLHMLSRVVRLQWRLRLPEEWWLRLLRLRRRYRCRRRTTRCLLR